METLTGKTRFRPYTTDDTVLLVLQVEVMVTDHFAPIGLAFLRRDWRDATVEDLCEIQHLTYANITLQAKVDMPQRESTLPGEGMPNARKPH